MLKLKRHKSRGVTPRHSLRRCRGEAVVAPDELGLRHEVLLRCLTQASAESDPLLKVFVDLLQQIRSPAFRLLVNLLAR